MIRKYIVASAMMLAVAAGSAVPASARGGGGMGHGGFGGMNAGFGGMHAGFGAMHGGVGGVGHASFAHAAFAPGAQFGRFTGARPFAFHGNRFVFRSRPFFRNRFAFFAGAPYGYAYDDSCYATVWTRWGWRWVNLCY